MHIETKTVKIEAHDLTLQYREAGDAQAPAVLLLHGWPTSSFLWRNVMPAIATHRRVLALDLPGFGGSDKPSDASYSFRFHRRAIDGFLAAVGVDRLGLAVHDLGGPVGLYWASQSPERVERLALLNTLVYPRPSWAVVAFVLACRLPLVRSLLASPWGLRKALELGVTDRSKLRSDAVEGTVAPFKSRAARRALLATGYGLSPKGFFEIARWLPTVDVPVRAVYGARDRILPDIERTMKKVKRDLPQTEVTRLEDCGHFLQEERPEEVGALLADFFAPVEL